MDKPQIKNGVDVLRQHVHSWARKGHLGPLSRDAGCAINALEEFGYGRANLPLPILNYLAREFFDASTSLDPETRMLKRTPRPATSIGLPRAPFDPSTVPPLKRWPDDYNLKPSRPAPKAPPRPGWAE